MRRACCVAPSAIPPFSLLKYSKEQSSLSSLLFKQSVTVPLRFLPVVFGEEVKPAFSATTEDSSTGSRKVRDRRPAT